ncbi:serine hydrolase domain-containing protein [Ornithinimicrobium cerasi]|uniref:serine hydrolase domain-containing protein n=1 Tax=Ornithinimicrobium cerasi TaxID=2248773 RepID=UPI00148389F3|nr:serine hydrolase domain-containing protein [Ornithinimicrobium cerasi]
MIGQGPPGALRYCVAGAAGTAGRPLVADDVFRIFSITKTFTAVMVMQLVEEGQLTLDTQVSSVLPDLDLAQGVTVRQLLDHSSGLPDFLRGGLEGTLRGDGARTWTPQEVLDWTAEHREPPQDPGTGHSYSNTNYVIAGMLIEEITGMSLAENLRTRITEPLGMIDTAYGSDGPGPVTGFSMWLPQGSSDAYSYHAVETAIGAAGAMVSTAPDLVTFLTALEEGRLLSARSWDQMTDFTTIADQERVGLGVFEFTIGEQTLLGHGGDFPGYQALAAFEPASGEVLVVLTNDDNTPLAHLVEIVLATS